MSSPTGDTPKLPAAAAAAARAAAAHNHLDPGYTTHASRCSQRRRAGAVRALRLYPCGQAAVLRPWARPLHRRVHPQLGFAAGLDGCWCCTMQHALLAAVSPVALTFLLTLHTWGHCSLALSALDPQATTTSSAPRLPGCTSGLPLRACATRERMRWRIAMECPATRSVQAGDEKPQLCDCTAVGHLPPSHHFMLERNPSAATQHAITHRKLYQASQLCRNL